jgi:hypothetical protein
MTATATLIDGQYNQGQSDGNKSLLFSVSITNPYSTGGELVSISGYFPKQFRGGHRAMVNPSVTTANAGVASTATIRGDTSSTASIGLQFWNAGLSGTASAGLFVDNTVANLSGTTLHMMLSGN